VCVYVCVCVCLCAQLVELTRRFNEADIDGLRVFLNENVCMCMCVYVCVFVGLCVCVCVRSWMS